MKLTLQQETEDVIVKANGQPQVRKRKRGVGQPRIAVRVHLGSAKPLFMTVAFSRLAKAYTSHAQNSARGRTTGKQPAAKKKEKKKEKKEEEGEEEDGEEEGIRRRRRRGIRLGIILHPGPKSLSYFPSS